MTLVGVEVIIWDATGITVGLPGAAGLSVGEAQAARTIRARNRKPHFFGIGGYSLVYSRRGKWVPGSKYQQDCICSPQHDLPSKSNCWKQGTKNCASKSLAGTA